MQISEIVLYGHNGERRILPLKVGKTTIITGRSKTGKSALIDIVDYCLGRTECTIAEGVIRDTVAWFGLKLQFPTGQMFIARQAPPPNSKYNNRVYFEESEEVQIPENAPTTPNTTNEGIEKLLTVKLGISPNLNEPPIGETRLPLAANIRHALFYCFQPQNDIAQKNYLFHRQYEDYITQAIKDTLPYFLGAIQENRLALEQELRRARRELRRVEQILREAESIKGKGISKAQGLLSEARQVGLISSNEIEDNLGEIAKIFKSLEEWNPDEEITDVNPDRLTQLQEELRNLENQYSEKNDTINAVKTFANEAEGFASEAKKQELRLESINLFKGNEQSHTECPACLQTLKIPVPTATAMQKSLADLRANLDATVKERPRLREYIDILESESEDIRQRIREKNEDIKGIISEEDSAKRLRDLNSRRARVVGRVSLWTESVDLTDESSHLRDEVENKKLVVKRLEEELNDDEKEEKLNSILNRISVQMTKWANELQLEHSKDPMRFDLANATVVVDREDRPISLSNMGSGENWVGIHLIAHLALHQYFIKNNRPVPNFLFLDQPTQVYYPSEKDSELEGNLNTIKDEDRQAVLRLFNLIFDFVESVKPNFQIIITDHANLTDTRFQDSIEEIWRDGNALIPKNWIKMKSES